MQVDKIISSKFSEVFCFLKADYLQITQQDQPIYISHNVSLQEHIIQIFSLYQTTFYFPSYPSYLSYLNLFNRPWTQQILKWHKRHDQQNL